MSDFLNLEADQPPDGDDIDALNDETFGCDINDINDDWEEDHKKFVGDTGSGEDSENDGQSEWQGPSTQFIDSKCPLVLDTSNVDLLSKLRDSLKYESPGSFSNFGSGSKTNRSGSHIDFSFPDCEDLIKKSVFDVVSDEGDLLGDYVSDFSHYDADISNGSFRNLSVAKNSQKKEEVEDIDLESLRPPSPSILPLDLTFMSNVWRPPSPDQSINISNTSNHRYSPKDSTPKAERFNSTNTSTPVLPGKLPVSKVLRLEDLEADLSRDHLIRSTSSPKNFSNTSTPPTLHSTMLNSSSAMLPGSPYGSNVHGKSSPGMVIGNLAALSLGQMMMNNASSIPSHSKMVQPPPGFTLPQTSPSKISSPVQTNRNDIGRSSMIEQQKMAPLINLMNSAGMLPKTSQKQQAHFPPFQPMVYMRSANEDLDRLLQQRQIIDKIIITPAQAQRSYHHSKNYFDRNLDKFAGFMTQKEKDWLIKIFRLQCKVNDPYVEDYYEVNYMLKKNSMKILAKQKERAKNGMDDDDFGMENEPILVLPEFAKAEETGPKYIQFDNALGKIQVLSSKCPRKLVEFKEGETTSNTYRLGSRSRYLLKIERLYELLLDIADEDKRMPILPEQLKQQHRDRRTMLCNELYKGLVISIPKKEKDNENQVFILINRAMPTFKRMQETVDSNILKINKGLLLVIRSLIQLQEVSHLIVLLASLMPSDIYDRLSQIDKDMKINIGAVLSKALSRIPNAKALLYVVSCVDKARIFADNRFGSRLLRSLFKQYELSEDKLLYIYFWKLFVQTLIKSIPETEEETQSICSEHLAYLNQL